MNKRMLIIDDDEELCQELTDIFQNEGFDVGVAHNGSDGRILMESVHYQMVILDLKLPGIRGSEVLKLIKGSEPGQKVIILSGKLFGESSVLGHPLDEDEIIFHSADAVMKKPLKVEDLIEKVRELTSVGNKSV